MSRSDQADNRATPQTSDSAGGSGRDGDNPATNDRSSRKDEAASGDATPQARRGKARSRRRRRSRADQPSRDQPPANQVATGQATEKPIDEESSRKQTSRGRDPQTGRGRSPQPKQTQSKQTQSKQAKSQTQPVRKPEQLVKKAAEQAGRGPKIATEKPLSSEEIAQLKQHFSFLKDYRKQLKLKLNAQEDLLINGVRTPTHRGVCQHLLSKVEYSRVAAAAARMGAKERLGLIEGVLRFSSELPVLLLYLESLQLAEHQGAPAALEEVLRRIDFRTVSEGQMLRLLDVIIQLFPDSSRPALLTSLLEGRGFRGALDAVLDKLPTELSAVIVPMRAVYEHVLSKPGLRTRKQRDADPAAGPSSEGRYLDTLLGGGALTAGVELLLLGDRRFLARRHPAMRKRLIQSALTHLDVGSPRFFEPLLALCDTLQDKEDLHLELKLALVNALVQQENDSQAEQVLAGLCSRHPAERDLARLLKALRAPKLGRYALLRARSGRGPKLLPPKTQAPLRAAYCLDRRADVWIRSATDDDSGFVERAEGLRRLVLPGVRSVIRDGQSEQQRYLVYARQGRLVGARLGGGSHSMPSDARLDVGLQLVRIVSALDLVDRCLPDLHENRFELTNDGQLWLLEYWDLLDRRTEAAPDVVEQTREALEQWLSLPSPPPEDRGASGETKQLVPGDHRSSPAREGSSEPGSPSAREGSSEPGSPAVGDGRSDVRNPLGSNPSDGANASMLNDSALNDGVPSDAIALSQCQTLLELHDALTEALYRSKPLIAASGVRRT